MTVNFYKFLPISTNFHLFIISIVIISGCAASHKPAVLDAVTQASPIWLQGEDEIPDSAVQFITAYEVRQKQLRQENILIIDVRSGDLYAQSHIQGALSLPLAELEQRYTQLPQDKELILYCGGDDCPLSKAAAKKLIRLGFWNVKDMQEGIAGWERQGFPIDSGLE